MYGKRVKMSLVIISILTLTGIGLLFGTGLALAAQRFKVITDPRVDEILEVLPGSNCGACGFAGCRELAEAMVKKGAPLNCVVLDDEGKEEIARILGRVTESENVEPQFPHLLCHGGIKAKDRFIYQGLRDCVAANILLKGSKECEYGCLGLGTCVAACPFDAITMGEDGLPIINYGLCTGCGRCVEACPRGLFKMAPRGQKVFVLCSSRDKGAFTRKVCEVGCIGCKKCEKACEFDAIKVIDNCAVIDYSRCTSCIVCIEVCPQKTIRRSARVADSACLENICTER